MELILKLVNNKIIYGCLCFIFLIMGTGLYLNYPFQNNFLLFLIFAIIVIPIVIKDVCDSKCKNISIWFFRVSSIIILVLSPLLIGMSININVPFIESILQLILLFTGVMLLIHDFILRFIDVNENNFENRKNILGIVIFVTLIICSNVSSFTRFLLEIYEPSNFIIIALTVVLLTATLSLLVFTYLMTFDNNTKKLKNKLRGTGEKFFKATLYSIIFLMCIFLIINYGQYVHASNLSLFPFSWAVFENLIISLFLSLISLVSGVYIIIEVCIAMYESLHFLDYSG